MELKKVTGSEPSRFEKLRGGTFINVSKKEIEVGESTLWEYYQLFTTELDEDRLEVIAKGIEESVLKQAKADALNSITVTTTNSNTFDGNETARGNMSSAILSAEIIGKTEDTWKLADNTSAVITITELKEALALSIQEVGRIVMVTSKDEL